MTFFFILSFSNAYTQQVELGKVNWLRNYDEAISVAENDDKPILVLFQEVPGCATCRNYGSNILSNPLLTEVIENLFVPLVIYNNHKGEDRRILEKFKEPSWNNPVVRIIDENGNDLHERLARNYSIQGLYLMMQNVLTSRLKKLPEYFDILGQEINLTYGEQVDTQFFSMYCFWSGEAHFGSKYGVLSTEPGFMNGKEVVKLKYDKSIIGIDELKEFAQEANCSNETSIGKYRKDKDLQYYLKKSNYKYIPLSLVQRTKINAALKGRIPIEDILSPSQMGWLDKIKDGEMNKDPLMYTKTFEEAWSIFDSF